MGNFNHVKLVRLFLQRTYNNMIWFNQFPLVVLLKYFLIRFTAENDHSFVALVAGRTRSTSKSFVTSSNSIFFIPKFTSDSNSFVTDILLVSKKAAK